MAGELGRARSTLKELREEIVEASRERGVIQDEYSTLLSGNNVLRQENGRLERENAAVKELGILAERDLGDCARRKGDAISSMSAAKDEDARTLLSIRDARILESGLTDRISALEKILSDREKDVEGKGIFVRRMEEEIRDLLSQKIELEHNLISDSQKLVDVRNKHDHILGAIDEAFENFRLFERRIAQFSEDTGYIVGYTRPDTLLAKG